MHGLLGGRNQLLPLLGAERFIKLACVVLNLLYALAQIGGGAARGRRRIVEFIGKLGRHRAELDELLALLCVAFHIAQSRRQRPDDFSRHRRRGAQQFQESSARQAKKPAVSDCSNEDRIRDVRPDWNLAEEFSRNPRREKNFLFAEELRHAQLAFQHHIEEIRRIAFA